MRCPVYWQISASCFAGRADRSPSGALSSAHSHSRHMCQIAAGVRSPSASRSASSLRCCGSDWCSSIHAMPRAARGHRALPSFHPDGPSPPCSLHNAMLPPFRQRFPRRSGRFGHRSCASAQLRIGNRPGAAARRRKRPLLFPFYYAFAYLSRKLLCLSRNIFRTVRARPRARDRILPFNGLHNVNCKSCRNLCVPTFRARTALRSPAVPHKCWQRKQKRLQFRNRRCKICKCVCTLCQHPAKNRNQRSHL